MKNPNKIFLMLLFILLNNCKFNNNNEKQRDNKSNIISTKETGSSNKSNSYNSPKVNIITENNNNFYEKNEPKSSGTTDTKKNNNLKDNNHIVENNNLDKPTLKKIINKIKSGEINKIIIMTGAGISVNAGIPDFRSKNGLYSYVDKYQKKNNLKIYNNNEDFFEINKFKEHPEHFFKILSNCGKIIDAKPTLTHYFFKLLNDKQILLKYYTQNIDCLEDKVNLPKEKIVRYHGSFTTSTCSKCNKTCKKEKVFDFYKKGAVPYCNTVFGIKPCDGILKPDVVFFGENPKPSKSQEQDFKNCKLLIVIGTSLKVSPFNKLVKKIKKDVPRILINMEKVGDFENNPRKNDIFLQGDCDKTIEKIIKLLGWKNDLENTKKIMSTISSMKNKFGERFLPEDENLESFYDKLIKLDQYVFNENILLLLKVYENYFVNYNNRESLKQKLKNAIYNKAKEYDQIKEFGEYKRKMEELTGLLYMGCFWDSINNELSQRIGKRKSMIK